jgi:hypothetical protein
MNEDERISYYYSLDEHNISLSDRSVTLKGKPLTPKDKTGMIIAIEPAITRF